MYRSAARTAQETPIELEHLPGQQEGQGYEHCLGAVEKYEGVPCPCLVEDCKCGKQPGDPSGNKCSNDHTYVPALSASDGLNGCTRSFTQQRNACNKKDCVEKYSHGYWY